MIEIDPVFFSVGPVTVRWYGLMAALGMVAAYAVLHTRAKKYSFTSNDVSDMVFYIVLAGFVGARLLYVVRFWNEIFREDPLEIFRVYNGGLVFLGGFGVAALMGLLLCRLRKWKLGAMTDFIAPALPIGHAFGRMGCLLNGCCYGFDYEGPLAFKYQYNSSPAFPLQGLAFLLNIALGAFILYLESRKRLENRRFLVYVLLYCVLRFALEFGRGDYPREQLLWGLTPAQISCLWLLPLTALFCLALHFYGRGKNPNKA